MIRNIYKLSSTFAKIKKPKPLQTVYSQREIIQEQSQSKASPQSYQIPTQQHLQLKRNQRDNVFEKKAGWIFIISAGLVIIFVKYAGKSSQQILSEKKEQLIFIDKLRKSNERIKKWIRIRYYLLDMINNRNNESQKHTQTQQKLIQIVKQPENQKVESIKIVTNYANTEEKLKQQQL